MVRKINFGPNLVYVTGAPFGIRFGFKLLLNSFSLKAVLETLILINVYFWPK